MNAGQRALRFLCEGSHLVGILDTPERPLARGMLIVTGGPQYRIGSHRQFTLMARMLAARGIPAMRFDHRGSGDSEGAPQPFEALDQDIRAAIREFFQQMPDMKEIVVLGLCDAATAAAFYAHHDARIRGLILLNPWIGAPGNSPPANTRHYYLGQQGELAFWRNVVNGGLDIAASAGALRQNLRDAAADREAGLPQRVVASLSCFDGKVMVVLGGQDPSAQAFAELMAKQELECKRVDIPGASHSFASRAWRDEVAEHCANWMVSW
jgi:exosortase A-associated hydrolase 1